MDYTQCWLLELCSHPGRALHIARGAGTQNACYYLVLLMVFSCDYKVTLRFLWGPLGCGNFLFSYYPTHVLYCVHLYFTPQNFLSFV